MADVTGRQWVLVVFGTPLLLLSAVLAGYTGLFVVPGGPCHGGGDLTIPDASPVVTANDSAVTVVHTGEESLGGPTTDRIRVAVEDAETREATSRVWIEGAETAARGDSLTITEAEAGFTFSGRDTVTVRWDGKDPDVAGFCPNGRTLGDLTRTQLRNASIAVRTS